MHCCSLKSQSDRTLITSAVAAGVPEESFSIISPYSAQVAHLTKLLRTQWPGIEVGTVDGFQVRFHAEATLRFRDAG